ncbi:hypothetical protein EDB81DRAFT_814184 [Dactylonectria macrodidyma]|uniref:PD-(D/E)XK nuclease-like domain-containing protein n=1 Tax=Dactylonectria macrodidyma TaxID=307937 RepID=A0A9P9IIR0_9HYPO|nr:hypothetical protein EDB81DRAFT_814184 [Dactylonectria macrodidyma]
MSLPFCLPHPAFMNHPGTELLDAFIERWLDSVANFSRHGEIHCEATPELKWSETKRSRNDMPTPPTSASTPTRSSHDRRSPKRPRPNDSIGDVDDEQLSSLPDDPFDNEKTPNALARGPAALRTIPNTSTINLPARPVFRQTPSLSSASSAHSPTRSSARSSSPVKRSTLKLLKKPVFFTPIEDDPTTQLPDNMLPTYDRIVNITLHREEFLPRVLEPDIRATHRRNMVKPYWFFDQDGAVADDPDPTGRHVKELAALREIETAANTCQDEEASEAAWNLEVHGPLLKLAFAPYSFLRRDLLISAQISKPFIPEMQASSVYDYTRAKMVDWGVRALPDASTSARIRETLISLPEPHRCVNQTTYGPVRYDPIAMVVETKIGIGAAEEARLQVGIWIAAWHQRIELFKATSSAAAEPIITIPLIIIMEHEWRLLFACDRGTYVEIVEDIIIGDTRGLIGLYTILATLRALASWSQKSFLPWVERLFTPKTLPS